MAKEQWHSWGKLIVIFATVVFAGGGYALKVNTNEQNLIIEREERIEADRLLASCTDQIKVDVHQIQIEQQKEIALKENLLSALDRVEKGVINLMNNQNRIELITKENSVKLGTLTKD